MFLRLTTEDTYDESLTDFTSSVYAHYKASIDSIFEPKLKFQMIKLQFYNGSIIAEVEIKFKSTTIPDHMIISPVDFFKTPGIQILNATFEPSLLRNGFSVFFIWWDSQKFSLKDKFNFEVIRLNPCPG